MKRRLTLGLALVIGALLAALVSPLSRAEAPGKNGRIAGVATATYFALGGSRGLGFVRANNGALAVFDAKGRPHEIWRCPRRIQWCGDMVGLDWSPDGRRLALSSTEIAARSTYPGLHIIDLRTGADRRIPAVPRYVQAASLRMLRREVRHDVRILGCSSPTYLSWSPDGSQLAYNCLDSRPRSPRRWGTRIYTIQPDGTGRGVDWTPAHFQNAYAPSWSPDARSIAFSTCELPVMYKNRFNIASCHSSLYVGDLDGRNLRRLAAGALPDWSPNGQTIAYVARACGRARIRLVTPSGRDVTPAGGRCGGIGPPRSIVAAWSPDGGRIAVATRKALYVMNADGTGLERLLRGNFINRALWQPRSSGG